MKKTWEKKLDVPEMRQVTRWADVSRAKLKKVLRRLLLWCEHVMRREDYYVGMTATGIAAQKKGGERKPEEDVHI